MKLVKHYHKIMCGGADVSASFRLNGLLLVILVQFAVMCLEHEKYGKYTSGSVSRQLPCVLRSTILAAVNQ